MLGRGPGEADKNKLRIQNSHGGNTERQGLGLWNGNFPSAILA